MPGTSAELASLLPGPSGDALLPMTWSDLPTRPDCSACLRALPALPTCAHSWALLLNRDALVKLVPTVASCAAMIATLEHFSHPLALPGGALLLG